MHPEGQNDGKTGTSSPLLSRMSWFLNLLFYAVTIFWFEYECYHTTYQSANFTYLSPSSYQRWGLKVRG